eukprot:13365763-Alexandrium_andersonii.AAC.1
MRLLAKCSERCFGKCFTRGPGLLERAYCPSMAHQAQTCSNRSGPERIADGLACLRTGHIA